jgi:hypothetical protein
MLADNTISFVLPSLPPSSNRCHTPNFRERKIYLSDEARRWQSQNGLLVPRFTIGPRSFVRVDYVAFYPLFTKAGKLRRVDTHNFGFLLFNTIAARIGIDDCYFKSGSFDSVDSEKEYVSVVLTEMPIDS